MEKVRCNPLQEQQVKELYDWIPSKKHPEEWKVKHITVTAKETSPILQLKIGQVMKTLDVCSSKNTQF